MSKKRKHYSNEFKAKVALAVIQGEKTVPQLTIHHYLHPTQIAKRLCYWVKIVTRLIVGMAFSGK